MSADTSARLDPQQEHERLLSVAAHDLREPLRAITGFAELLERDKRSHLSEQGREFLGMILQAGARMDDLLDGISRYNRAGRTSLRVEDVDLAATLETVRSSLPASPPRPAEITSGELPVVPGDRAAMEQVLAQLIANAVTFNAAPVAHVHVAAAEGDAGWELTVRDDGIGIPERERVRVFEMFRRLHPREAYPGTGVGLAVCRRLVERQGGRIWVEEAPTGGSAFHVALPVQAGEPA